jgi:hypothetical protein
MAFKRDEPGRDLLGERGDRMVEEVDVVDDLAADDGVVGAEVTRQGLLKPVDLASHPALGHLGEDDGVTGS